MNQDRIQPGVVQALYEELGRLSSEDFGKRLSAFMDEQPHLTGFLFNLDDDFSEERHTHILKTAIVVRDVLVGAGMPLDVVDNATLETVVQEKVQQYDDIGDEAGADELIALSSSPELLKKVVEQSSGDKDLILIQDVIIGVLEESVADRKNRDNQKDFP